MKSSISNIWLLGLVALFIFVFAGYLAVTISYSAAFKMKDEALTIIEKHKGITDKQPTNNGGMYYGAGTMQTINAYLHGMSYKVKGKCPKSKAGEVWYGMNSLEYIKSPSYEQVNNSKKYFYCFAKYKTSYAGDAYLNAYYYKVDFFFKMDVPVLGDIFTFEVPGTTNEIYQASDALTANR